MADNQTNNNNSDEIDLGQLFQLIQEGLNKVFIGFLRMFLYLKKNIFILSGLIILGLGLGYGLNQIISKKLKTEVIIKPNLESKNYLYDVVSEIGANIKAENQIFFENIDLNIDKFKDFEISINRVEGGITSENDMKYLELLQSFESTDAVSDIVRAELQNKSSFNHRITFFYKDAVKGQEFARKIMKYINTNDYFNGLVTVYRENAKTRIEENRALLKQVDGLIDNYSKKMIQDDRLGDSERIVLDNQERINITGLFNLKNNLIKDIEQKNVELLERTESIKVINFGKTQEVQKSFFGKNIILIPSILIGLYFIISLISFLNKRAIDIIR